MDRIPKYKIGDIVKHRFDDRIMEIEVVNHDLFVTKSYQRIYEFKGIYHCSWTDSAKNCQEGDFSEELLILVRQMPS